MATHTDLSLLLMALVVPASARGMMLSTMSMFKNDLSGDHEFQVVDSYDSR
jgi:hypothetical protein